MLIIFSGCATNHSASSTESSTAPGQSSASPTDSSQQVFTLSDLEKYNGQNGALAYVAVDGIVYDVSNVKAWSKGSHNGFSAGQDLTQAIEQSPHGAKVLPTLPVVGVLQ